MKSWCYTIIMMVTIGALATPVVAIADPIAKLKNLPRQEELPAIMEEIFAQGPHTIPALIELLKETAMSQTAENADTQDKERLHAAQRAAMELFAEWKAEEALGALEDMANNSTDMVTMGKAIKTIGRIGGEKSFRMLERMLMEANNSQERRAVDRKEYTLIALGACKDNRAVPLLQQELFDQNNTELTRIYAASALGQLGNPEGIQIALQGTTSEDNSVRHLSIEALGLINSPLALDRLREIATSQAKYVYREAAARSIVQIEFNQLSPDDQVDYLYQKLSQHPGWDELVSWGTVKLQDIHTSQAREALQRLADEQPEGTWLRIMALRVLHRMN